jgi:nucleoside-diphosphate-sugar epimerase
VRSKSKSASLPKGVLPVIVQDIGPQTDWSEALQGVSEVVHLAARVHAPQRANPNCRDEFFQINIAGTARLARFAAEAGVRRMVFISTVKVHGEGKDEAYSEADGEAPQGAYAVSKREAENILREISQRSSLETVILRPPLVYGPGVGANFLRLIQLIDRRVPMPFASVSNRRSLIFVENLVDAILACLQEEKAAGRTYLVADAESPSTPQLITQIAGFLGVAPRLFAFPPLLLQLAAALVGKRPEVERLLGSLAADASKVKQELKWQPRFSLIEGLAATIEWYRGTGLAGQMAAAFK